MRRLVLVVLIMVFATLIAIGFLMSRESAPGRTEDYSDLTLHIPRGNLYGGPNFGRQLDLSPDGKRIVYVGQAGKGSRTLFVHTIGENEPRQIQCLPSKLSGTIPTTRQSPMEPGGDDALSIHSSHVTGLYHPYHSVVVAGAGGTRRAGTIDRDHENGTQNVYTFRNGNSLSMFIVTDDGGRCHRPCRVRPPARRNAIREDAQDHRQAHPLPDLQSSPFRSHCRRSGLQRGRGPHCRPDKSKATAASSQRAAYRDP